MTRFAKSEMGMKMISARGSHVGGPGGNAIAALLTASAMATSPAGPPPQCVATATAANNGAKGVAANSGHVNRVNATAAVTAPTAPAYARTRRDGGVEWAVEAVAGAGKCGDVQYARSTDAPGSVPEHLEGVRPVVALEAGDAPELGQRLD